MKKNKLTILTLLFLALLQKQCFASIFWDIREGIKLYNQKKYEMSRDYFESYVRNNPNDKDGYYYLALCNLKLKDNEHAKNYFKASYELAFQEGTVETIAFNDFDDSTIEDYFDMSALYFESGDIKQADLYADMMLKLNNKSSSAYFIKAKIAHIKNNDEKAVQYLTKAIIYNSALLSTNLAKELNITTLPQASKELYRLNALEEYYRGNINSAIDSMQKYLAINPDDWDNRAFLASLYITNNNINLADNEVEIIKKEDENNLQNILNEVKIIRLKNEKRDYSDLLLKANKINPNNPKILLELGNLSLEKKDYNKALEYFNTLINVNDRLYEGYFGYIYSLIETGKTQEAMENLRKITALNNETSEISFLLAKICALQGSFSEALDYIKQALKNEKNPNYYLESAKINYILAKYSDSIDDLKKLEKMGYKPLYDETYEMYLKNYLKLADKDLARKYIDELTPLDKNRIMYKYYLYELYKLEDNIEQSAISLKQLKKARPTKVVDYLDMSELNYNLNDFEGAIQTIEKGLKKFPNSADLYYQKVKLNYLIKHSME